MSTEKFSPINEAFSREQDKLQIVWDATSLKNYQFCPRYYQYANLEGWADDNNNFEFGRFIATAFERFKKLRVAGKTNDEALLIVLKETMNDTWIPETETHYAQQWGGAYKEMWKCTGENPYKNAKGNRAKCPFAFEAFWSDDEAPDICGECGSPIRKERRYVPENTAKNRKTLIRTIIWYALSQPENLDDGLRPYVFPDGRPAVELSGKLPLPFTAETGETYVMAYNFDYIGQFGSEKFIVDNKTTKKTLNEAFFAGYNPDTQFDTYDLVASTVLSDLDIRGTMVEGVQVTVGGSEFGLHPYYKTDAYREEHLNDLGIWLKDAEQSAKNNYWRMNKRSCWICPFKGVCALAPKMRDGYLKSNFTKREVWNPARSR